MLTDSEDKQENHPVEIFTGTAWEVALVKSLLENAEIKAYVTDEIVGTLSPWWTAPGGAGAVRVFVSKADFDVSIQIVKEFENTQK